MVGTSSKVMSESLALLGIVVASGEWCVSFPRLVKGVLEKEGEEVLELVRSWVSVLSPYLDTWFPVSGTSCFAWLTVSSSRVFC